ncbi:MAG: hypothetical protein AAB706_01950, partial [Patescibacteria group bacterium]
MESIHNSGLEITTRISNRAEQTKELFVSSMNMGKENTRRFFVHNLASFSNSFSNAEQSLGTHIGRILEKLALLKEQFTNRKNVEYSFSLENDQETDKKVSTSVAVKNLVETYNLNTKLIGVGIALLVDEASQGITEFTKHLSSSIRTAKTLALESLPSQKFLSLFSDGSNLEARLPNKLLSGHLEFSRRLPPEGRGSPRGGGGANIFGSAKEFVDTTSLGIYRSINNFTYNFLYKGPESPTVIVQNFIPPKTTPPPQVSPKVAVVSVKEPQKTTVIERIIREIPVASGGAVTREEFERRLEELNNKLSAEIYTFGSRDTGVVQYFSPSAPVPVQHVNRIDKLSAGVDIESPVITGGSWTGGSISAATFSGTTVTGTTISGTNGSFSTLTVSATTTIDTDTFVIDPGNNRVGIGTSSPSDTLSVNGPIFLANTSPSNTANRIYANGGDLYYAGSLIGGATTGNWATDGTSVWRVTGNVGIGTTSPYAKLSVVGETVSAYFTATTTTE